MFNCLSGGMTSEDVILKQIVLYVGEKDRLTTIILTSTNKYKINMVYL